MNNHSFPSEKKTIDFLQFSQKMLNKINNLLLEQFNVF